MDRAVTWGAAAALGALGLALVLFALGWLYSESVIEAHYPLLSMDVPAPDRPDAAVAHGRHLARLMGCLDCHGADLRGRTLELQAGFVIAAPNLTRAAQSLTDEEFARAIRDGLGPDGKSLWGMPSQVYTYMSVADVTAILAYVHSLPPSGAATPAPRFGIRDRIAIVAGRLEPTAADVEAAGASLDLGPRYEGGRYIARTTCAQCHGLDLTGSLDGRTPDLVAVSRYRLADFFALLREGRAPDWRPMPVMHGLARRRFSEFRDYEVMALYDYLSARAAALPPTGPAKSAH